MCNTMDNWGDFEVHHVCVRKQFPSKPAIYFLCKSNGAGGIYDDLVIEPLGDYRYIYNHDGRKGIARAVLDPETKTWDLELENMRYFFKSAPLDVIPFKIPTDLSIEQYLNGTFHLKNSKEIYQEVIQYLKVLYDLPGDFYYHIIAIGTLQSWIIDLLYVVFYLCFSARFGAGKTAFLEGLAIISRHGFLAGNISPSSIARTTYSKKLTLFGDELDVKAKGSDNETYLTYRQGYKRNNPYVRQKETQNGYVDEIIETFGMKGYSIHGKGEDALSTRSIEIPLRISNDTTLPILNMFKDQIGTPLFEDLFFWYLEHGSMLKNSMMETKATEMEQEQQRKQKQRKEKDKERIIHGADGFVDNVIELLYIGQTKNLKNRIGEHDNAINNNLWVGNKFIGLQVFDCVFYKLLDNDANVRFNLEAKYIQDYYPKMNKDEPEIYEVN